MAFPETAQLLAAALSVLKELLGLGPVGMRTGDIEIYITDYEGEARGEARLVEVSLREASVRKWLISGVEVLGPRRFFRHRRIPVAPRGHEPQAWTKRLTPAKARPGLLFQLHDDAPGEFIVRVHVRERSNSRKRAYRDEEYTAIDWEGMRRKGQIH